MRPFTFVHVGDEQHAPPLVDLMRFDSMRPTPPLDVAALPLGAIELNGEGVRIGAMVRDSELAHHPLIVQGYPALSEALLSGASPQLRNMGTIGGNLMHRGQCQSDTCVALIALGAVVLIRGSDGMTRAFPMDQFHPLPRDQPGLASALRPGELITHVDLPGSLLAARSHYVKARERASYAFGLVSTAVALEMDAGAIRDARVALRGVGTNPWRSHDAERALAGRPASLDTFQRAAAIATDGARHPRDERGKRERGKRDDAFETELARRTVVRALREAAEMAS